MKFYLDRRCVARYAKILNEKELYWLGWYGSGGGNVFMGSKGFYSCGLVSSSPVFMGKNWEEFVECNRSDLLLFYLYERKT